jgi:hypothetical protein
MRRELLRKLEVRNEQKIARICRAMRNWIVITILVIILLYTTIIVHSPSVCEGMNQAPILISSQVVVIVNQSIKMADELRQIDRENKKYLTDYLKTFRDKLVEFIKSRPADPELGLRTFWDENKSLITGSKELLDTTNTKHGFVLNRLSAIENSIVSVSKYVNTAEDPNGLGSFGELASMDLSGMFGAT